MIKKLGYLLNEAFWEKIFYNLIYSNFNQELFDSTDEANFQNICYLVFISLFIYKHFLDNYSLKNLNANIEGYFILMKKCLPEIHWNSGDLLEELLKYSALGFYNF